MHSGVHNHHFGSFWLFYKTKGLTRAMQPIQFEQLKPNQTLNETTAIILRHLFQITFSGKMMLTEARNDWVSFPQKGRVLLRQ